MKPIKSVREYSDRWQRMIAILYTLNELRVVCEKREVVEYIHRQGILTIRKGDLERYEGMHEPVAVTCACWGKKTLVMQDLIQSGHNQWGLTRLGRLETGRLMQQFKSGFYKVDLCDVFTSRFRRILDPSSNGCGLAPALRIRRNRNTDTDDLVKRFGY
jgi:hypothetical protein